MADDHFGLGVTQRIADLCDWKPDVHRLEYRTHHRNREIRLEITMTVPVHHRDYATLTNTQASERRGKPANPRPQLAIGHPHLIAVYDLLVSG